MTKKSSSSLIDLNSASSFILFALPNLVSLLKRPSIPLLRQVVKDIQSLLDLLDSLPKV